MRHALSLTAAALAVCVAVASAQTRVKTFRDPHTGVSFQYPVSWKTTGIASPLGIAILQGPGKPLHAIASVGVPGIAHTTLTGVVFTFAATKTADEPACELLTLLPGFSGVVGDSARWVTVGDDRLWRSHGSNARAGFSADEVVYAAFRPAAHGPGDCLLFEEDLDIVASGLDRTLAEPPHDAAIALALELQGIIETVKLPPVAATIATK
jgi:hypothetical protein